MAKVKSTESRSHIFKAKRKRPGVHSKCKSSQHKGSKNYKKLYKSQGR